MKNQDKYKQWNYERVGHRSKKDKAQKKIQRL